MRYLSAGTEEVDYQNVGLMSEAKYQLLLDFCRQYQDHRPVQTMPMPAANWATHQDPRLVQMIPAANLTRLEPSEELELDVD